MKGSGPVFGAAATLCALVAAATAVAQPLTAEEAVKMALANSSQAIRAEADVLDARGGLYSAYSRVMPQVSAGWSRSVRDVEDSFSQQPIAGNVFEFGTLKSSSYTNTPQVSGSWSVLDLSSIQGVRAALSGMKAARHQRSAARNDVVYEARRQFYEVVRQVRLAQVAEDALKLARDDERRVRALFEVGSVSKSDLLKAQVRTSQSELDSLVASHNVRVQRITLARLIGVPEATMAPVDTALVVSMADYDEAALVTEAASNRPDLMAVEAELRAAKSNRTAARFARLPYVTLSGSATFDSKSKGWSRDRGIDFGTGLPVESEASTNSSTDRSVSGTIALNWDLFDGFSTDARNAAAKARLMRAEDARDAARRNLESDVHEALIAYDQAVKGRRVAERTIESATENLKLTQQKYNVGSATILDLIDAQVQLQRAQSDGVSALVAIRIAEAQVNRARGQGE